MWFSPHPEEPAKQASRRTRACSESGLNLCAGFRHHFVDRINHGLGLVALGVAGGWAIRAVTTTSSLRKRLAEADQLAATARYPDAVAARDLYAQALRLEAEPLFMPVDPPAHSTIIGSLSHVGFSVGYESY